MVTGLGRRGHFFGLVAAASLVWGCHDPDRVRSVQATATVDVKNLDFGEVPVGEWAEREVKILNIGYVPFFALEALGLDKNPAYEVNLGAKDRIDPGYAKAVKVRFRPLQEGETRETVRVATDANTGAEETIPVRGMGSPARIGIEPPVVDFETLEVDSNRTLSLRVTNPAELPLTLQVAGPDGTPFTIDTITIPPKGTHEVKAEYFPKKVGDDGARVELRACETCTPSIAELKGKSAASAFAFKPAPVPFEEIPVHERTRSKTMARNITWKAVKIAGLATSDAAFTPLSQHSGQEVGPGQEVEVQLEFAARSAGPKTGTLTLDYASNKPRKADVMLDARGGQPTLAVAPVALDFGELPVGGKKELLVRITNAGVNGNLSILGVRADGNAEQFNVAGPNRGAQVYGWTGTWPNLQTEPIPVAPGADAVDIRVFFEPRDVGTWQANLTIVSDAPFTPERTIVLTGKARPAGICQWRILPQPALDFGNVPVNKGAVLGFQFGNVGQDECVVKDIRIANSAGGAFFMPGGELTGGVLAYDTQFSAMIAFKTPVEGEFSGELQITINNPQNPVVRLPLRAVSRPTCLAAAPPFVDFGPIRYDCATTPRRTFITNQCAAPVTVDSTTLGQGTSNQFSILNPLPAPRVLQPGEGFELETSYARNVLGQHYTPLYAQAAGEPSPLMVPLLAETNHEGLQRDDFLQGTDSQLDVLFVVSNTTTMAPYQARLRAAIPTWLERARAAGVDLRVGVTTTGLVPRSAACGGGADGGEAGRLFPVDGSRTRVVTSGSASAALSIQANLDVGLCHNLVQGLETMRQALSSPLIDRADDARTPQPNDGNLGFLRPAARLAVVMLADEDDHSGFDPESYIQLLQSLKGTASSHRTQLYALVPTSTACTTAGPSAPRIVQVARSTGGAAASICQGDYTGFLDRITQRAGGMQADFPLTQVPTSGMQGMSVRVRGVSQSQDRWTYDAGRNAVVFNGESIPLAGQTISVRYRAACAAPPEPFTP